MNRWQDTNSYATTIQLWPEVAQMEQGRQFQAVETIVQMLYLLPFAVAGLIWLTIRTDYGRLSESLDSLAILFVAMALLLGKPFTLRIRLGRQGDELKIASSLAPLVMWSALFISGPSGIWAMVLAAAVAALRRSWKLLSHDQNPTWQPLSFFTEQVGIYVFSTIVAASLYLTLGGESPITGTTLDDWLPAFAAIIVGGLLTGLILLPAAVQINSLSGTLNSAGNLVRFYVGAVSLPFLMSPFAVIIAILDAEGKTLSLVFVLLGIYLVNRLAHFLSKAEARSRQHARELDQLERLANRIIEAPPDASTLSDVLAAAIPGLFPRDRVVIHLFESDSPRAWKPFDLTCPPMASDEVPYVDGEKWQALYRAEGSRLELSNITLPGQRRSFGQAIMVKIMADKKNEGVECAGGVYLLRHKSVGHPLDSLSTVESLASQIGTALSRAQNHAEMLAFHKTQQELAFAGRIQSSFLPKHLPQVDKWQFSAKLISARQTSGDFYDFIPLEDGLIGIVVADVSDKGTGAALYMALSRTLLRTYAMQSGRHPEIALTKTNERIRADAESDQFVTLIYGVLDPSTDLLTYANAGHNPGYLLRAASKGAVKNGDFDSLTKTGIPLGMFEGIAWTQATVQFKPGDVLVLYTDGVSEAQNLTAEEYGDHRLLATVRANLGRTTAEIQQAIIASIDHFVGDAPQFDDVTLLVVAREA